MAYQKASKDIKAIDYHHKRSVRGSRPGVDTKLVAALCRSHANARFESTTNIAWSICEADYRPIGFTS